MAPNSQLSWPSSAPRRGAFPLPGIPEELVTPKPPDDSTTAATATNAVKEGHWTSASHATVF
jgi:hypothetical protein